MKTILFTLLALFIAHSNVYACTFIKEIDDGSVSITLDDDPDSGMYHVRAPKEYKGASLKYLILSANNGKGEISLPLAIKSKSGVTGSYFHMSPKWLNVRVSANYEGKKCLELIAKLGM